MASIIDVKVKTLNSQTHDFSVENSMTVRQFKEHIADTVNIQPELQRIIYRGRILNDSVELKEYDMHGKVVHLVERPPPGPGAESNADNNPQPNTTTAPGRRRVFLHRGPNGQPAAAASAAGPALSLSSTLCLNRITVARHMLQCAQNIINHMDNPELPLDNSPMNLLVQESMDTTVVEVGISAISDADQVQDIMHAFRGAVNAAFRPGAGEGGADESDGNIDLNSSTASSSSASSLSSSFDPTEVHATAAALSAANQSTPGEFPPPGPEDGQAAAAEEESGAAQGAAEGDQSATTAPTTAEGRAQQTTSPRVLGEVVEEMRNVQRRLEPHMQRYYDILMNEPTYSAEETTRREDDQREFDRVSEALHYMAHAQHAISDLMLDLSSSSPRHLCCRPILIEHSAFVNPGMPPPSGEILLAMSGSVAPAGGFQFTVPLNGDPPAGGGGGTAQAHAQGTPRRVFNPSTLQPGPGRMTPHHQHVATIPILVQQTHNGMPTMEQLHQSAAAAAAAALNSNGIQELIQSIVSAVPMATIELQRGNEPPITINAPPGGHAPTAPATEPPQAQTPANNEQSSQTGTNNGGRTTSATTMPTTATQTRSTARPQVHVTSIQQPTDMRNPRPFSSSAFAAFDRYLPCNSHHVRDQQARAQTVPGGVAGGIPAPVGVIPGGGVMPGNGAAAGSENDIRIPHGRIEIPLGFPFQLRRRPGSVSNSRSGSRERPAGTQTPSGASRSATPTDDLDAVLNSQDPDEEFMLQTRDALRAFIVAQFFKDSDISVDNIKGGVSEIVIAMEELLAPISNYEHPHICIRLSVLQLLRTHLQEILNLLRREEDADASAAAAEQRFGSNLIRSIRLLASRLSGILLQSNQRRQDIRQLLRTIYNRHLKEMEPQPLGRLLRFALKICLQSLDTKFGASDTNALTPYLVYKSPSSEEASPMEVEESELATSTASVQNQDVNMEVVPSSSGSATPINATSRPLTRLRCESDCEDYPEPVAVAPWHANVPHGWVAALASDVEEQRKITDAGAQPMSDAYLEGMTKKRRKTITDARPTGSVAETISAGVREVIQNSGFQTTTPVDQIATQISSDVGLQSSYRESMNAAIRTRLRSDPNYDPTKYSNAEKYFK